MRMKNNAHFYRLTVVFVLQLTDTDKIAKNTHREYHPKE